MNRHLYILPAFLMLLFTGFISESVSGAVCSVAATYAAAGREPVAQEGVDDDGEGAELSEEELTALEDQMEGYMIELGRIATNIDGANKAKIDNLSAMLLGLGTRYDAFMQMEQENMVSNELLMQLMAQYKVDFQAVSDSLAEQKKRINARSDMHMCEKLFAKYVVQYDTLLKRATEYSLIKQTASQLDKVKATEAMLFKDVEKHYQAAQAAVDVCPDLRKRITALENQYADIREKSAKIQAAEFKPFMARIQDYLKNCAYFAIIMMFLVMLQSKLSALKAARKQAQKMKDMLHNNEDYPTI